jgi:hypothetical protein
VETVRFFLGCAAYRTMEPVTAQCREDVIAAMGKGPAAIDVGVSAELVGAKVQHGYGCCPNLERLTNQAVLAGADVLLFHDADMAYEWSDAAAVLAAWARHGPRAMAGAVYPEATDGGRLVGALSGLPNECGVFTRPDVAAPYMGKDVEADFLGLGLAAVPTGFFAGRERPWWRERWDGAVHLGPDVFISGMIRAEGWKLVAALEARPGHLSREWRTA